MQVKNYILIGLIIIGGIVLFTFFSSQDTTLSEADVASHANYEEKKEELLTKIKEITQENVTPEQYKDLRIKISSYSTLDKSIRESLLEELKERYTNESFDKIIILFSKEPIAESEIYRTIDHLETIGVEDKEKMLKLVDIRKKIQWYSHYTQKLPKEIDIFCNKENSEIEEEEFGRIKSKLSISYKEFENRKAIKELKSKMQDKISKKEKEWENYYDELY